MLQFMWLQGIGHDLVTEQQHQMHYEKREKKCILKKYLEQRNQGRRRERELRGITLSVFTKELTETMKIFPSTSNNALEI